MENNILSTLTKEERKLLAVKTLKKGAVLFKEGELCTTLSIIVSGEVKISTIHHSGNEIIFNIIKKDALFGNNLLFSDQPYYKGDVIALKDSTIVLIQKNDLIQILQSNNQFLIMYLNIQSNFGKSLNSRIKMLTILSAEERFLFYLEENHNEICYHTVTELADILNIKRETLSRILTKLEKKNVIKRSSHLIALNN